MDLNEAKEAFWGLLNNGPFGIEDVSITNACNRVLAKDLITTSNSPPYTMANVDGYAVAAADTMDASPDNPITLEVVGKINIGTVSDSLPYASTTFYIPTGGMIPDGADAVIKVEDAELIDDGKKIKVTKSISMVDNILLEAINLKRGKVILEKGLKIRPDHISLMAEFNYVNISVTKKPEVAIFSTGDEIIDIGVDMVSGKIRDTNSYTIAALVEESGGIPRREGIVPDDFDALKSRILNVLDKVSMVILTGGTAAGGKDFTAEVLNSVGKPGVIVNGIKIKNGRPIILAVVDGKPLIGLAGYPPGAMYGFDLVAKSTIHRLLGMKD